LSLNSTKTNRRKRKHTVSYTHNKHFFVEFYLLLIIFINFFKYLFVVYMLVFDTKKGKTEKINNENIFT